MCTKVIEVCLFRCRQSCRLFYSDNPVKILRGRGQYLFDENDVRYLDCISNVQHGKVLVTQWLEQNTAICLQKYCYPVYRKLGSDFC